MQDCLLGILSNIWVKVAKQNKVKYGHGSFEFRSWDLMGPIQDGDINFRIITKLCTPCTNVPFTFDVSQNITDRVANMVNKSQEQT